MTAAAEIKPWTEEKKQEWFGEQTIKRSYNEDILVRLGALDETKFTVEKYGALSINPSDYQLYAVKVGDWDPSKPNLLITGGVHGYETSGAHGAVQFLEKEALSYSDKFNILVAPCVSPWAYETVNRLNPAMQNPNREFVEGTTSEEAGLLMAYLKSQGVDFDLHLDLHETTNSDKTTFIPTEMEMKGIPFDADAMVIPDGFYLIYPHNRRRPELENKIIEYVSQQTHIAEPDTETYYEDDKITVDPRPRIGGAVQVSPGVHETPVVAKGLCQDFTTARDRLGAFTTEVYPDSPRGVSPEECNNAQVAAVKGALDYWIPHFEAA